jgi:hypothetical protein
MDEPAGKIGRAAALVLAEDGALDQTIEQLLLVHEMMGGDLVARRGKVHPAVHVLAVRHLQCDHAFLMRADFTRFGRQLSKSAPCMLRVGGPVRTLSAGP